MAAFATGFFAVAAHADVAPLAGDARAALVLDRAGSRVLWTNSAGLRCLGARHVKDIRPLPAAGPTARRVAAVFGRLVGDAERVERIPLPMGFIPVQAVCSLRRIVVGDERLVLLVVADGTARMASDHEAETGYAALLRELAPEQPQGAEADRTEPYDADKIPAAADADQTPEPQAPLGDEADRADAAPPEHVANLVEPVAGSLPIEPAPEPLQPSDAMLADDPQSDQSAGRDYPQAGEAGPSPAEAAVDRKEPGPDAVEDAAEDRATEDRTFEYAASPEADAEAVANDETAATPFRFAADARTLRFVFELDPHGVFTFVSPELADAVGPKAADVVGRSFDAVAADLGIDPLGRVRAALQHRDTFTGITVDWPVEDAALRVPVDLAGMPVISRDRTFRGYRGFGLAKCGAAFEAPLLVGAGAPLPPPALTPEEIALGSVVVEAETEDGGAPVPVEPDVEPAAGPANLHRAGDIDESDADDTAAAEAGSEETTEAEADLDDLARLDQAPGEERWSSEAEPEIRGEEAGADETDADETGGDVAGADETGTDENGALEPSTAETEPPAGEDRPAQEVASAEDGSEHAAEAAENGPEQPDETAPDDVPDEAGPREPSEEPEAEEVEPAAEPEHADDLGDEWPGGIEDPPPPVTEPDPFEPGDPIGDDEADLSAVAALDGASAADIAAAELGEEPPDVDPGAPDAAPPAQQDDERADGSPAGAPPLSDLDVEWRDTGGEVIQSPIVPRSVPVQAFSAEETSRRQLSRPEREAFQKIAEALGARFEDGPPDEADALSEPADPGDPAMSVATPTTMAPMPIDVAVLDRLPVAVAILKDGEAVIVNKAFLDLAGYPDRATLEGAGGFADAFAGSTLPRDASLPAIRRRDGVEIPVSARLHSIPWQGGIASLLVVQETAAATGRDRAAAAESRVDELEAILDTATDGVLVLDGKGTVLGANRSAEALFGTDRSRMVGEPILDLLAPESHRAALDYLDGLARNGVASVLNDGREVIGRVRQGGLVPLFMTIGRISSAKFCAVLRDITQWKRAEEELTNAKRSAETASSQKSDFLAKISHEIRTPLNAIIGFSEVMMEERFGAVGSERYKEYLRDIHLSGAHIMSLVNDLLDLSKIEAGKLDLAFEAVPANEVIRECVALMQPQANRERVIIRTSLSSSLPNVVADSRSLRQIVLNLVSNAIKFNSPGGQVIVSTLYEDSGEVAIRVRDTGPGMSEEDIGKALEPFRQLHTSRPGRGTGLGLPLTKALVEANRAAFRIESAVGQGTMVQITFPSTRVLAE